MNVTASVEIALRNAVCENLTHHFAVPNWLIQPPVPFQWLEQDRKKIVAALDSARRAKYSKMTQAQKAALDGLAYPSGRPAGTSHLKQVKDRRKHISVSEGNVIAELTLYFWKRLYGPEYEQSLWRTTLKRTFPNKTLTRARVAERLEHIYQSRNRLAHHEPVLHGRFNNAVSAIEFVIQNLEQKTSNPNSALSVLLANDIAEMRVQADALHARLASFQIEA
jgi:hypothetical protein